MESLETRPSQDPQRDPLERETHRRDLLRDLLLPPEASEAVAQLLGAG